MAGSTDRIGGKKRTSFASFTSSHCLKQRNGSKSVGDVRDLLLSSLFPFSFFNLTFLR